MGHMAKAFLVGESRKSPYRWQRSTYAQKSINILEKKKKVINMFEISD